MTQVIIFGSSSSFGNTRKVIDDILGFSGILLFDLNNFDISPFDFMNIAIRMMVLYH
ncbi:MAG: hypothetical protein O2809_04260 [Proteobacteria bacterium]|nr:hypothetical protein [Pseudomonadota bacterium]